MHTTRIVLTEPFVRHPAGLVFELDEATGVSGWDDDERVRDRQNFSDKRVYFLPDGGNGGSYELPSHMTAPCPPEVFVGVDLRTGPCRITGAWTAPGGDETSASPSNLKYDAKLLRINDINAQGIEMTLERKQAEIILVDVLRSETLRRFEAAGNPFQLDFSELPPGFYKITIHLHKGPTHYLQFIKAFPYIVEFQGNMGSYQLHRTLY
ncbi:MAG: hypothetical protein HUU34_21300 [Saprospiraceae bacterium]|nr:hypothetical protein [Saprospiraceae bacterium]